MMNSVSPLHSHHPLGTSEEYNNTTNNNNNITTSPRQDINNVINHDNNNNNQEELTFEEMTLSYFLHNHDRHQTLYQAFKTYCKQLNDIIYHRILSCHSSIRIYRKHISASELEEAQELARTIFSTYLTRQSITLDNQIYNSIKFLATTNLQDSTKLESLLNDSSGSLFTNTGYESGLFGSLKSSGNNTITNNNNITTGNESNNSNNGNDIIPQAQAQAQAPATATTAATTIVVSNGNEPQDFISRMTIDLFDKVEEFMLNKLDLEFNKFKQQQIRQQQQLQQQQLQQQQQHLQQLNNNNIDPLSSNHKETENNQQQQQQQKPTSYTKKIEFMILPGEIVDKDSYPIYYIDNLSNETIPSMLFTTNFRMIFVSKLSLTEIFSIPLTTIYRIDRLNSFKVDQLIGVWCKDFRKIEFFIIPKELYPFSEPSPQHDHTAPLINRLRHVAFPTDSSQLFAYKYCPPPLEDPITMDGWRSYDLFSEFIRQDLNFKLWRTTEVNCEYSQPTYPARLVVPDVITDDELRIATGFRSKGRIPTICWVSKEGVPLARSSQPMVGITRARCAEDERLVDLLRESTPGKKSLHLLDARPKANAIGNLAKGMGYEMSYNCNIEFLGIGNIHAMRDSINRLELLIHGTSNPSVDDGWLSQLEATKWLDHVRTVLLGATRAVELISSGHPVLLHCSDGWDRTSQLSSLALLMLDPYYRTIRGFQVLIEKEWLSFGHMFANRVRHGDRNFYTDSQRSPVFQQFIDCVYQLLTYYHDLFEFNEQYLIAILDALYSCQYGTFLCNTERERSSIKNKTVSLWTFLNTVRDQFLNPFYNPEKTGVPSPLPIWRGDYVHLWRKYYYRYSRQPSREPLTYERIATILKLENNDLKSKVEELQQQIEKLKLQQQLAETTLDESTQQP